MNDVERWINLEGPEPEGIRQLMNAGREAADLTPEQAAQRERSFFQALAAQRQRRARARTAKWTLAGLLSTSAAAAALLTLRSPAGTGVARGSDATVEAAAVEVSARSSAAPVPQGADAGPPQVRVKPRAR